MKGLEKNEIFETLLEVIYTDKILTLLLQCDEYQMCDSPSFNESGFLLEITMNFRVILRR